MPRGKSTDALMRHIRDNHGININGSVSKRKLVEMGYYHGYKAYRFYKTPSRVFNISDFEQVIAIYNFDNQLKKAFYQPIMQLETTLKNVVVNYLVADGTDSDIYLPTIFERHLTSYRDVAQGSREYKERMKQKLKLKQDFEKEVSFGYGKKPVVTYYIDQERQLPIWAYFEIIMLGTFGNFVNMLGTNFKIDIAKDLGTYDSISDPQGTFLEKHIYALKDLRNAVSHNSVIFDTRFRKANVSQAIGLALQREFNLSTPVNFNSIVDYLLLLVHYFNALKVPKTEVKRFVREVKLAISTFDEKINDTAILFQILGSDYSRKLDAL